MRIGRQGDQNAREPRDRVDSLLNRADLPCNGCGGRIVNGGQSHRLTRLEIGHIVGIHVQRNFNLIASSDFHEWSAGRHRLAGLHVNLADDSRRRRLHGLRRADAAPFQFGQFEMRRIQSLLRLRKIDIGREVIIESLLRLGEIPLGDGGGLLGFRKRRQGISAGSI